MSGIRVGFALCGSFCTLDSVIDALEKLREEYDDITPIMSEHTALTDSRFGTAASFRRRVEEICGKSIIDTIPLAEPIGPKKLLDVLVIAPCTGNTISKLAHGITDTCVTMAAKAHLRNSRPVVIAVSTNDALSGSAPNIGTLLTRKNIYFVPMYQDDAFSKPCSMTADFLKIPETIKDALAGEQIQPLLITKQ